MSRPQTAEQLERELGTLDTPDPWTPARAARWWEQHDPQAFASNREVMTG